MRSGRKERALRATPLWGLRSSRHGVCLQRSESSGCKGAGPKPMMCSDIPLCGGGRTWALRKDHRKGQRSNACGQARVAALRAHRWRRHSVAYVHTAWHLPLFVFAAADGRRSLLAVIQLGNGRHKDWHGVHRRPRRKVACSLQEARRSSALAYYTTCPTCRQLPKVALNDPPPGAIAPSSIEMKRSLPRESPSRRQAAPDARLASASDDAQQCVIASAVAYASMPNRLSAHAHPIKSANATPARHDGKARDCARDVRAVPRRSSGRP